MGFQEKIDELIKEKRLYFVGERLPADWYEGFRTWMPLAEAGDPKAQYNIGRCYELGTGVDRDFAKALEWYQKAIDQNEPRANYNVALMYEEGERPEKARSYFEKAATLGDVRAKMKFEDDKTNTIIAKARKAFFDGDKTAARELFKEAAALGSNEAKAGVIACDVLVKKRHFMNTHYHSSNIVVNGNSVGGGSSKTHAIKFTFENNSDQAARFRVVLVKSDKSGKHEHTFPDYPSAIEPGKKGEYELEVYEEQKCSSNSFCVEMDKEWYCFQTEIESVWFMSPFRRIFGFFGLLVVIIGFTILLGPFFPNFALIFFLLSVVAVLWRITYVIQAYDKL